KYQGHCYSVSDTPVEPPCGAVTIASLPKEYDNCKQCVAVYKLTPCSNCEDCLDIWTDVDLSDYVEKTVFYQNGCYTVSEQSAEEPIISISDVDIVPNCNHVSCRKCDDCIFKPGTKVDL